MRRLFCDKIELGGDQMRIDKLLSHLKFGSRKEIHQAIKANKVKVDGVIVDSKDLDVEPKSQEIYFNEEKIVYFERVVLMFYKPKGVISAHRDKQYPTVLSYIKDPFNRYDLNIAGRLDVDAEGLIILTDDGNLLHEIISPKNSIYKTYHVKTEKPIDNPEELLKPRVIKDGRDRLYTPKTPIIVAHDKDGVTIKISEGKFHQVKRMFEAIGHRVIRLKRIAIHDLKLDVGVGEYRQLNEQEINMLRH